ncbi:MAG: lytic transglycosylase domain-containing protein [Candidatus Binataceae bacterium]
MSISISVAAMLTLTVLASVVAGQGVAESAEIDQAALFRAVGSMYGVDPELLGAIARVESAGRADAVSPAGAVGLMQLMPSTARRFEVSDRRDPVENVLGAARYLAYLRASDLCAKTSSGSLAQILAAYNAGEGAVCRYGGLPPYEETRGYVGRVLWIYLGGSDLRVPGGQPGVPRESVKSARNRRAAESSVFDQLEKIRQARATAHAAMPVSAREGN